MALGVRGFLSALAFTLSMSIIMFSSRMLTKQDVPLSMQVGFLGVAAVLGGIYIGNVMYPAQNDGLIQFIKVQYSKLRSNELTSEDKRVIIWFIAVSIGAEGSWIATLLTEMFVNAANSLCLHRGSSAPFIAFLAWYFIDRKPTPQSYLSMCLCLIGVGCLLIFGSHKEWNIYLPAIFISVVMAGFRFVGVEKLVSVDPILFTSEMLSIARLMFGGIFMICFFLFYTMVSAMMNERMMMKNTDISDAKVYCYFLLGAFIFLYPLNVVTVTIAIAESGALWTDVICQSGIPLLLLCDYIIANDHNSIGELIGIGLVLCGSLIVPMYTLWNSSNNDTSDPSYIQVDDEPLTELHTEEVTSV